MAIQKIKSENKKEVKMERDSDTPTWENPSMYLNRVLVYINILMLLYFFIEYVIKAWSDDEVEEEKENSLDQKDEDFVPRKSKQVFIFPSFKILFEQLNTSFILL